MLCSGCNSFAVYAILILLQFSAMTLAREELFPLIVGDPCQMNGVNGACATSCKVLEDGYKRKLIKRSDFVHCGYTQFEEIICCPTHLPMADAETGANPAPVTTTTTTTTTTTAPVTQRITPISTDRPSVEICKRIESKLTYELSPHILDGIPAFLGEFPHAALIQFNTEGTKCGGALIDPKFVLTAAHCVINPRKAPISVRVGMVDAGNTKQGQEIRIVKLHIHPDYNSKLKYNDIALLELETAAFDWETVSWETVGPACLQTDPTDPPAGRPLIAIGWGLTNVTLRTQSEKLLKVELQLHDNNECNKQYQTQDALSLTTLPQGIINTQICAYASGKDACAGDSGGPLNLEIDSDRKYYNIIGVVSTGFSCGTDTPGLYTRVSSFLPYIESVVWPNGV